MVTHRIVAVDRPASPRGTPRGAQEPTLATVLARAGAYVAEFQRQLSGIVAEEHYVQEVGRSTAERLTPTYQATDPRAVTPMRTNAESMKPVRAGRTRWAEYRDVFEVDGTPVRDRDERLTKLFLTDPARCRPSQLWPNPRGKLALQHRRHPAQHQHAGVRDCRFLDRPNQPRFRFRRAKERVPARRPAAPVRRVRTSTEVWVIEHQETARHDHPDRQPARICRRAAASGSSRRPAACS